MKRLALDELVLKPVPKPPPGADGSIDDDDDDDDDDGIDALYDEADGGNRALDIEAKEGKS